MAVDKKRHGGRTRFVLLKDIGEPQIVENVPAEEVMAVLKELSQR